MRRKRWVALCLSIIFLMTMCQDDVSMAFAHNVETGATVSQDNQQVESQAEGNLEEIVPFSVEQPDLENFYLQQTNITHDARTILVQKKWRGDSEESRPDNVTFYLYQEEDKEPIATITLSKADAVEGNENIWETAFPGKYPIYDNAGKEIKYSVREDDITGYRSVQDGVDTTTSEGYKNVSVFVPVTEIIQGQEYLVSSGIEGNVSLYRAEAYQTDGILSTEEGMVQAIKDGRIIEEALQDGTYIPHSSYILISDETINGEKATDYMTWRAAVSDNGSAVLSSSCYRLWGEKESNDPDKWSGYLSTEKDKKDGLCVYKKRIENVENAPEFTKFYYDSSSGGFKTQGSEKVVYLYKKITIREGTFRTASSKFKFTNWKNVSTSDPLDQNEKEPEPFTNISVEKKWTDGNENHENDRVSVVLKANGIAVNELILNAENNWKNSFTGLKTLDESGNEIIYTIEEEIAEDNNGNVLGYIPEVEEVGNTKKNVWLPVDRPTKEKGGGNYIVIAFPNNKSEIGQNIWEDGDYDGKAERIALTSNPAGTKFALGSKNANNTQGASMNVTVTEGPLVVNGKTYTNYIKDEEAYNADGSDRNTIIWNVEFQKTGIKQDYGPWERDLFSFKALAGKGGYLSTQGSMTLESKLDTGNNSRTLFAYGMICNSEWGEFESMSSQGYTEDQLSHMVGAMDHYALRTDKSPGKFGEKDCTYPALYLYKKVGITEKSYVLTNRPVDKVQVSVKKIWKDNDNKDSVRPADIKVELFKNGWATGNTYNLSDQNEWKCVFENLDKTDSKGNIIEYSVKEYVSNADQYETEYNRVSDENGNVYIEICNTQKEIISPIKMPETGSFTRQMLIRYGIWLLLAGMLLIIGIQYRKEREIGNTKK